MSAVIGNNPIDRALDQRYGQAYVATAMANLATLRKSADWGWLRITRPAPTAAFSRRDALAPGYSRATEAARRHGFEPIIRPAGGRLVAYHQGALVVDVLARHPVPAAEINERFRVFGTALASALRRLGVDARLGPVAGEYCPGRFSVNAGGRTKLAGTAQRLTSGSFLLTAVVMVSDPEPIRAVLTETYDHLHVPWDPTTVDCVANQLGGVTMNQIQAVLLEALAQLLPLGPLAPDPGVDHLQIPMVNCWQLTSP